MDGLNRAFNKTLKDKSSEYKINNNLFNIMIYLIWHNFFSWGASDATILKILSCVLLGGISAVLMEVYTIGLRLILLICGHKQALFLLWIQESIFFPPKSTLCNKKECSWENISIHYHIYWHTLKSPTDINIKPKDISYLSFSIKKMGC